MRPRLRRLLMPAMETLSELGEACARVAQEYHDIEKLSGEESDDCSAAEVAPDRVELVHELMTAAKIAMFGEAGPCAYDQDLYDQLAAALARGAGTP